MAAMTGHPRLNVLLTGASNTYLDLPVKGEIELFELGVHGRLVNAVFRRLGEDGRLSAPVEVRHPVFTYSPAIDVEIGLARQAVPQHPVFPFEHEQSKDTFQ
jgi:hypothetical protein